MRQFLASLLGLVLCILANGVHAEEVVIVSPEGLADMEGNSEGGGSTDSLRVQYLYPSTDFSSLTSSQNQLVAIAWRPNSSQDAITAGTDNFTLRISTTPVDELGFTYADNTGVDEVVVFDGPITFTTTVETTPRRFDFRVDFQEPFFYDPSQGNLLVDFAVPSFTSGFLVDNQDFVGDKDLLVQSDADDLIAVEGFSTLAVMEFTFIPEPATGILALGGLLFLLTARRRRTSPSR